MRSIEPFPAPDVPVTTMTGVATELAPEEANELGPLAVRETSHRLRLADPRLGEEPRGLDAASLGTAMRMSKTRCITLRRLLGDLLDVCVPVLEVALQLGALHADVIRALQSSMR